jgi:polyhydroxyalkanoate synthesis regulator phasin
MPKQKNALSPKEQSERFRAEVERLVADGELSPAEADKALGELVGSQRLARPEPT